MQTLKLRGSSRVARRAVACASKTQKNRAKAEEAQDKGEALKVPVHGAGNIYLGNGKFIDDDPAKYPDRDGMGVGGWAGGEKGLTKFLEEVESEQKDTARQQQPEASSSGRTVRDDKLDGDELVYVGKGEFVRDDPRKYGGKEDAFFLRGATGGFAGGEKGVTQFIEQGKIELADPDAERKAKLIKDVVVGTGSIALLAATGYALSLTGWFDVPDFSIPDVTAPTFEFSAPRLPSTPPVPNLADPASFSPPELPELPAIKPPAVDVPEEYLAVAELGAIGVAGIWLLLAAKRGVENMNNSMWADFRVNSLKFAVLAAAAYVAYEFVLDL